MAILSAPHHPPRLMLASIPQESSSSSWQWTPVTALDADLSSLPLAAEALRNMRCEVLDVKPTVGDASLPMQAVVQVRRRAKPLSGAAVMWRRAWALIVQDRQPLAGFSIKNETATLKPVYPAATLQGTGGHTWPSSCTPSPSKANDKKKRPPALHLFSAVFSTSCTHDQSNTQTAHTLPPQHPPQVSKAASGPCPAIIVPHGGPHTALAVNYYMPFSFLTALGYCIIAVNYRGSLGFGEAGVQSLPGHIGHNDVEDCVAALDAAVAAGEPGQGCCLFWDDEACVLCCQ